MEQSLEELRSFFVTTLVFGSIVIDFKGLGLYDFLVSLSQPQIGVFYCISSCVLKLCLSINTIMFLLIKKEKK